MLEVGYVNVDAHDNYDLGYGLCKEFWHKGIVTEACKAVIEQLRKDSTPYIAATHDVNNKRSGEVARKLGMQYQYSYEHDSSSERFLQGKTFNIALNRYYERPPEP